MSGLEERLARRGGAIELLRLPAALFSLAARLRGRLYDLRLLPRARTDVPVISVGNLTTGGTGKTPMVVHLCEELLSRGLLPGVLARGYGRAPGAELNDEGQLLARRLPRVPQVQDPDRVAGAERLLERGVDVIVLDDGFQHRRLGRDLDLVLIDATRPFGLPAAEGEAVAALLPRGLLREPPSALARADALVLTRVDGLGAGELADLEARLLDLAPGKPLLRTRHAPRALRGLDGGGERPLSSLRGAPVRPLCAIGHPRAFLDTLASLGARLVDPVILPDHHLYTPADLAGLEHGPGAPLVVTTAKDAVKLAPLAPALPMLVLEIELELLSGAPVLEALLDSLPEPPTRRRREGLHAGLAG